MSFKVGDIVVSRFSKASRLRSKVYKVVDVAPFASTIRVASPSGKQRDLTSYSLQRIEDHSHTLERDIEWARSTLRTAERKVTKCINKLAEFRSSEREVSSWFPRV